MRISIVDDCAENEALCAAIDLSLVGVRKGDIDTWPNADDDEIITVALLVTEQTGDQAPYDGGFAEDIDDSAIIALIESWQAEHPERTGMVYVIGIALDDAGALPVSTTIPPTCACIPGRGEFAARSCPGPTEGALRVGYGAGDGTDEPCDCPCHREAPTSTAYSLPSSNPSAPHKPPSAASPTPPAPSQSHP